jgi:L-fuculose-phosphate aldolase
MFRKSFFGVYHGAISAKIDRDKFLINKNDAIFDEMDEESVIELHHKKDYRWKDASIDAAIHSNIYQKFSDAKYIAYAMPPYATAYASRYSKIYPEDYFGYKNLGEIAVYDPKTFEDWYERADVEIPRRLRDSRKNFLLIRGYGLYVFERDINTLAKTTALVENSCRILYLSKALEKRSATNSVDDGIYLM